MLRLLKGASIYASRVYPLYINIVNLWGLLSNVYFAEIAIFFIDHMNVKNKGQLCFHRVYITGPSEATKRVGQKPDFG